MTIPTNDESAESLRRSRHEAKNVRFALNYGAGVGKPLDLTVPEISITEYRQQVFASIVAQFQKSLKESQMNVSTTAPRSPSSDDPSYAKFEAQIAYKIASIREPLFTTDVSEELLWAAYSSNLPAHYNCNSCRKFIQKYGGLVTITVEGRIISFLWDILPPSYFYKSVTALADLVDYARVTGVFLSSDKKWGTPVTGQWTHLSGVNPAPFRHTLLSADQMMAEKRQDYQMLRRGLADFSYQVCKEALRVLEADVLDRSEKTLGVARWLVELHQNLSGVPSNHYSNIVWRAVASAPPGFCHIRSTMISTLLEDILAGMDFDTVQKRWAAKMHPLQYRRPTTAPATGAIDQAEKIVEKLGLRRSFDRRFARLDEIPIAIWTPAPARRSSRSAFVADTFGMFGHLRKPVASSVSPMRLPAISMTWEKFARTVLPFAQKIEVYLLDKVQPFYGLTTAVHPDAPAILQWDDDQTRNPFAWYFHAFGSLPHRWNLSSGWHNISMIFPAPSEWYHPERFTHFGKQIFFAIPEAKDMNYVETGGRSSTLFPETLRNDLHGISSVVEAHSRSSTLAGVESGDANGIAFTGSDLGSQILLRVQNQEYRIDRMD